MSLTPKAFSNVKEGRQKIELRIFDEKRRQVNSGDIITFGLLPDKKDQISVDVVGLSLFPSFRALFETLGKEITGCTLLELLRWKEATYTKEEERKYGAVGFHIRLRA